MCRLLNIAMRDYQESVTIGQTDTRTHRQTPDKVIPMCRYASQATQKSLCIYDGKVVVARNYFSYRRIFHLLCIPSEFQDKCSYFKDCN